MKKIAILIIIFCILTLASIYLSIPTPIRMTKSFGITCSAEGANRFFSQKSNWSKFWTAGEYDSSSDRVVYKKDTLQVIKRLRNSIELLFHHRSTVLPVTLELFPFSADSTVMEWHMSIDADLNPVTRILQYRQARHVKRIMAELMQRIKSFLDKKENVYGIVIEKISTTDTMLVATRSVYPVYPSTSEIYGLVNTLLQYITSRQAEQTGSPIMNVTQMDKDKYELMVAVPMNKELPETGNIFFRRMVPGNFMSTEITGGSHTISQALSQLQLFMYDTKKTILAIPFQAMITDRSKETDTTKWLTRIYYPTM
ncbi:MAG: hypothetical protein ABJA57_02245 [Ginsengibacter sp.]